MKDTLIPGKYKKISSNNYETLLKQIGYPPFIVKKLNIDRPEWEFTLDSTIPFVCSIDIKSTFKNRGYRFEENIEFEDEFDSKPHLIIFIRDGDSKLIQEHRPIGDKDGVMYTSVFNFTNEGFSIEYNCNGIVAQENFIRL